MLLNLKNPKKHVELLKVEGLLMHGVRHLALGAKGVMEVAREGGDGS